MAQSKVRLGSNELPPNEPGVVAIPDAKGGHWRVRWITETQCVGVARYGSPTKLAREWYVPLPVFVKFLLSLLYP